jgi:hypothetical protein
VPLAGLHESDVDRVEGLDATDQQVCDPVDVLEVRPERGGDVLQSPLRS